MDWNKVEDLYFNLPQLKYRKDYGNEVVGESSVVLVYCPNSDHSEKRALAYLQDYDPYKEGETAAEWVFLGSKGERSNIKYGSVSHWMEIPEGPGPGSIS
jgi:hypothetical protein